MTCRKCGQGHISPSNLAASRYRCWRCRHGTPGARAAKARYMQSDKRKAVVKRANARRLWVGHDYYGHAASREQAVHILSHIRGRLAAFKGFANGKKAQGHPAR